MKVYEYLIKELDFIMTKIANSSLNNEVKELLLTNGYDINSKILDNSQYVIIPATNVINKTGTIAYADLVNLNNVTIDIEILNSECTDLYLQLISHEVEHLKRGPINIEDEDIKEINDLGKIYLKEEQIINANVAPILFKRYEKLVSNIITNNWIEDPIGEELIKGGILALYYNHKVRINELIKGTHLIDYIKNVWG